MNVLVTGGAGYVGSHTVRQLAASGHSVVVYDNLTAGHRAAVGDVELVVGDLFEVRKLATLLADRKIDAVMHFAALAYVGESVADPAKYYRNNIAGTIALLDAMLAAQVGRIVFSSTCATYGIPQVVPIDESTPQQPINPYGFTKLAIEHALADYHRAYGLRYAALRYFNAAGAAIDGSLGEDHRPETHLIPLVLQAAAGTRDAVHVFGTDYPTTDGSCVRDYVHVDDLARAHTAALAKLDDTAELKLNLGTGHGTSVAQIIAMCQQVTGRDIPVVHDPRRPGDPPQLVASCQLARQQLNWQTECSDLETIVATAWQWMQSHPTGYAD
jgi:UDP-glucose-4-epimerase GalE